MDSIITGAGATLSLSPLAPASYTQAGYGALTFTTIGNVTDLGDIPTRIYEVVKLMLLSSRGTIKGKGGFDLGNQTITVAIEPGDPGLQVLDTANLSDSAYSVAIFHPRIGTLYGRALVFGGPTKYGDVNSPVTRSVTLEYSIVNATTDGTVFVAI